MKKYAILRNIAFTKAKRNSYDRKWRELRQLRQFEHSNITNVVRKAKYAILRKISFTAKKRSHYDLKWKKCKDQYKQSSHSLSCTTERELLSPFAEEVYKKIIKYHNARKGLS